MLNSILNMHLYLDIWEAAKKVIFLMEFWPSVKLKKSYFSPSMALQLKFKKKNCGFPTAMYLILVFSRSEAYN